MSTLCRLAISSSMTLAVLLGSPSVGQELAPADAAGTKVSYEVISPTGSLYSGCKMYFPAEFLQSSQLFTKHYKAADLEIINSTAQNGKPGKCSSSGFFNTEKASLDLTVKSAKSIRFWVVGRMIEGRFSGEVYTRLTTQEPLHVSEVAVVGSPLLAKARANPGQQVSVGEQKLELSPPFESLHRYVYYRDGLMLTSKAEYMRPKLEQEARAKAEAARLKEEKQVRDAAESAAREKQQAALVAKRAAALSEFKCDEVKRLDQQITSAAMAGACTHDAAVRSNAPREMYLAGVKLEADKDRVRAKSLYMAIVERFPMDDLAIKAGERITALADVEAIESSNSAAASAAVRSQQETKDAIERANSDSANRQHRARLEHCAGLSPCISSCSSVPFGNSRDHCLSQCRSKFSGC